MSDLEQKERDLIQRCQQGDIDAYQTLYHQHDQTLLRLGIRMLGQQQDAEDAVQTTFIRLHKSIQTFKFRATIGTYLYRIMMNVCYDMLAQRKKQPTSITKKEEPTYTSQDDLRLKLEQHIDTLPDRMRACFIMFAIEGFKQQEIADTLELSIGTVKAHIHEAKVRLRSLLSD